MPIPIIPKTLPNLAVDETQRRTKPNRNTRWSQKKSHMGISEADIIVPEDVVQNQKATKSGNVLTQHEICTTVHNRRVVLPFHQLHHSRFLHNTVANHHEYGHSIFLSNMNTHHMGAEETMRGIIQIRNVRHDDQNLSLVEAAPTMAHVDDLPLHLQNLTPVLTAAESTHLTPRSSRGAALPRMVMSSEIDLNDTV